MKLTKTKIFVLFFIPILILGIGIIIAAIVSRKKEKQAAAGDFGIIYDPSFYFSTPEQNEDQLFYITTYHLVNVTQKIVSSTKVDVTVHFESYSLPSITTSTDASKKYIPKPSTVTQTVDPTITFQTPKTYNVDDVENILQFVFTNDNLLKVSLVVPSTDATVPPIAVTANSLPTFNADEIAALSSVYLYSDGTTADSPPACSLIVEYKCTSNTSPTIDYNTFPGWAVITLDYNINWHSQGINQGPGYYCPPEGTSDTTGDRTGSLQLVVNRSQYSTNDDSYPMLLLLPSDDPYWVEGVKVCCKDGGVQQPIINIFTTTGFLYAAYHPNPPTLYYYSKINCSSSSLDCPP
tara:strand:- start:686 stop:1735 length:1050 start_codon:yes stop_codon:yes gene_type:complete